MADRGLIENELRAKGLTIIGADEVGRGCLAGPVFAAMVALDYSALKDLPPKELALVRDSKSLTKMQRQKILPRIKSLAEEAYIAAAEVDEIEQLGILKASLLAMKRALSLCHRTYDIVLVDGNQPIPDYFGTQQTIVDGDSYCYSIAAASILAKEARDRYMQDQARLYPDYGFDSHVGYGTREHLEKIREKGICPLHRKTFGPVRELLRNRHHPVSHLDLNE